MTTREGDDKEEESCKLENKTLWEKKILCNKLEHIIVKRYRSRRVSEIGKMADILKNSTLMCLNCNSKM